MGTHKIINKQTGQFLTGILHSTARAYSIVEVDGTAEGILFDFLDSDWDVEELPAPLPTEPGMYVVLPDTNYYLDAGGDWSLMRGATAEPRTPEVMQHVGDLVRLVPTTTSIPVVEA